MAKIDLYDPKWVEMVFAGKNKEYGAYQLRKGTSGRNIKALLILVIAAALVGGFLAWKVIEQKQAEEQQAYMEAMELAKLQQQAKKEEKKKEPVKPKIEPKKEIPVARETQKFTAPVIKKDELVKEENQVKQMDKLDEKVAVGTENKEGTKDRLAEAVRSDIAVAAPPPPPAPKPEVSNKVFDVVEEMPHFPGGAAALQAFLSSNTKYPVVAQENGVQGRVIVSFVVERDGSITDVRVVRSVDPSLDREASRVVRSMPRWSPGKQNGSAVRVKYTVPVVFRLQ
ncbi:energy transducer TonB [Prevotella copri]|jgi:protein TonB|uniref:energy transducer TonB n=2 Tax=Prevotellaceae TaxID=171552 RepID=UPI000EC5F955|nr:MULTISPECIES: energy transducer TonB [Prevotellaceae]MBD9073763.1 energy transducer TonB [Prevotella sp.]MBD9261313.1 energy transducer TonB [Prevotella sp.]MBV3414407.1 energy transducer TonB [Segatella copri]MDF4242789.1 energy transducer TonB [Prevotella sp. B2-R-102]MEE0995015.1 energy transducer TonB [Prevotella sp.]